MIRTGLIIATTAVKELTSVSGSALPLSYSWQTLAVPPSNKHSIDRKNTLGHYTCGKCIDCRKKGQPANCRWATQHQQHRNAKNNRWYTYNGKTLILKDWARLVGLNYLTLYNRLGAGWSFEKAITKPARPSGR